MQVFRSQNDLAANRVVSVSANRWRQNCHLVTHAPSLDTAIIDPGYGHAELIKEIRERSLKPVAILATHAHFDHVASAHSLQEEFPGLAFWMHGQEAPILERANTYAMFLRADVIRAPKDIRFLGQSFPFKGGEIAVHPYPGHTPGGCVFSFQNALFTGDLLIKDQQHFGNLPGFDLRLLHQSTQHVFGRFPDDALVFPGHGRTTTLRDLKSGFDARGGH